MKKESLRNRCPFCDGKTMMNVIADKLANDLGCAQITFNSISHQKRLARKIDKKRDIKPL